MKHAQLRTKRAITAILDATGLRQNQFAEMIGASLDAVKSWTRKRNPNPLSGQFESRIMLATGAVINSDGSVVTSWRVGKRSGLIGKPFTSEAFKFWRTNVALTDQKTCQYCEEKGAYYLQLILKSAIKSERKARGQKKLPAVWQSFCEWLVNTSDDFNLRRELDSLGADYFWRHWRTKTKK